MFDVAFIYILLINIQKEIDIFENNLRNFEISNELISDFFFFQLKALALEMHFKGNHLKNGIRNVKI